MSWFYGKDAFYQEIILISQKGVIRSSYKTFQSNLHDLIAEIHVRWPGLKQRVRLGPLVKRVVPHSSLLDIVGPRSLRLRAQKTFRIYFKNSF